MCERVILTGKTKKEGMSHRKPWSDLPQELLSEIAKHLNTSIDVIRLRSVCKSWRSSFPPLPHKNILSPLLPLNFPFTIDSNYTIKTSFWSNLSLKASTVYLLKPSQEFKNALPSSSSSSSNACLIKVKEFKPGKLIFCDPLYDSQNLPKVLNLLDFRVLEIAKAYNLTSVQYPPPIGMGGFHGYFNGGFELEPPSLYFDKVVLFLHPACTSTITGDCAIAIIFKGGRLGFLRLINKEWSLSNASEGCIFDDIVNYKGKLCAIDPSGRAIEFDIHSLKETSIAAPVHGGRHTRKRLVESSGDLFLVVRNRYNTKIVNAPIWKFKVYKLNEEQHKWVEVESLGDRVLVVDNDCSFAVSAQDFAGCKGNCIFFSTNWLNPYNVNDYDGDEALEEIGLKIGVDHLNDGGSFRPIASYPGYSEIFQPPPTWFH